MQDPIINSSLPRVGITHGDFNGIGYELVLKAFSDHRMFESLIPVLYGQVKAFSYYKKNYGYDTPNFSTIKEAVRAVEKKLNVINVVENELKIDPGQPTELSAQMSAVAMKLALDDLRKGDVDALVMAPDCHFVDKTNRDLLFSSYKESEVMRVLVNDQLRIGLATDDLPLQDAIAQIDIRYLVSKLSLFSKVLEKDFGIVTPKIAVMGLNPYSGSNPVDADDKVVKAISDAQKKGLYVFGPFSSSQLFVSGWWRKYDAVMALYYEQGVLPLRFLSVTGCACYWAGLPVVCSAPLHGPAFDIANTNQASPDSFRKALFLALDVFNNRKG